MRKSARKRLVTGVVLVAVLALWATTSFGYSVVIEPFGDGMVAQMVRAPVVLLAGLFTALFVWFFPIYVVIGAMKLRDQRREEIDALGDDNVVNADPDGERKLHQYLTAMTSMEARIGMLQQPDPWVPRDQRPAESADRPPMRMSALGRGAFVAVVLAGVGIGLVAALSHAGGNGVLRFLSMGAAGGVLALPLAAVFALILGKTERADDARGRSSETA